MRRDTPGYAPPQPAYHEPSPYQAPKAHGRVGPVYTFVKTDPQANFKWGERHRAGAQYGKVKSTVVLLMILQKHYILAGGRLQNGQTGP